MGKIWMTANIEGSALERPTEDFERNGMETKKNKNGIDEKRLLQELNDRFGAKNGMNTSSFVDMKQRIKEKRIFYNTQHRLSQCVRNDLENIPITLLIAWGCLYSNANYKITTFCVSLFTLS